MREVESLSNAWIALWLAASDLAQYQYQSQLAQIKAVLGEVAFSFAWQEGRTMTLEQALELAQGALDAATIE